jgi:hypothetical protein
VADSTWLLKSANCGYLWSCFRHFPMPVTSPCVLLTRCLQATSSVRVTAAHRPSPRGSREVFSLDIPAFSYSRNLKPRGRTTCFFLHPAWKMGRHGRPITLNSFKIATVQKTMLRSCKRIGEKGKFRMRSHDLRSFRRT